MKTCRKDFQGRKSTAVLKLLCRNIAAGRFNWRRYCTPQTYFGQEICVTPLHCSYGQIGYTVHFPYSNMPEVEYDWEMGKLTVDEENWKEYLVHPTFRVIRQSCSAKSLSSKYRSSLNP